MFLRKQKNKLTKKMSELKNRKSKVILNDVDDEETKDLEITFLKESIDNYKEHLKTLAYDLKKSDQDVNTLLVLLFVSGFVHSCTSIFLIFFA